MERSAARPSGGGGGRHGRRAGARGGAGPESLRAASRRPGCFTHHGPRLEASLGSARLGALVTGSLVGWAEALPHRARSSSPWPWEPKAGRAAMRAGGRRRRWAGEPCHPAGGGRRGEGRVHAAAFFGQPAPARGPEDGRGGAMLAFRDSSWYQSGNSDVVRDWQRARAREQAPPPRPVLPGLDGLDGQTGVAPGPQWVGGGQVAWLATVGAVRGWGASV